MNTEVLKNQLENQLTIILEEQRTLTTEKTSADQDRNLMANRNLELENEIVEHLQGSFYFFIGYKTLLVAVYETSLFFGGSEVAVYKTSLF